MSQVWRRVSLCALLSVFSAGALAHAEAPTYSVGGGYYPAYRHVPRVGTSMNRNGMRGYNIPNRMEQRRWPSPIYHATPRMRYR